MAIPQYFLNELEARSNMGDIAESYVELKKRGKNLLGLCPFHNEKTPSFNIYPNTNSFYCFGCNAGGGVIQFIMRIENLDFQEAVRFLAQRAGMTVPEDGMDDSMARMRTRVLEINRETARFFHERLKSAEGRNALGYLRSRNLTDKTIKHFGLGYAPAGGFELVNHLKAKGFTAAEMIQANVVGNSRSGNPYDRFKGRVMFPIIDLRGNVIAFGGRILTDEKPKYINTSDTPVYKKSRELFALNFAKDSGERQIILAEGYMDVISLHQAGFTNTVASLGTSLTEEQAKALSRYADDVVICYDSDEAGRRAAQRAIPILKRASLNVKILAVPGNKDPDEFISSHREDGTLRFRRLLEESSGDVEYELGKIRAKYDMEAAEGKTRYSREAIEIIARIEDEIERDAYMSTIADETGIDKSTIKNSVGDKLKQLNALQRRERIKSQNKVISVETPALNRGKRANARLANAEEGIIRYLYMNPEKATEIKRRLPNENFLLEFNRRVFEIILENKDAQGLSMSTFSSSFTADEMNELARIAGARSEVQTVYEDLERYIRIMGEEAGMAEISDKTPEELKAIVQSLKKSKQGVK